MSYLYTPVNKNLLFSLLIFVYSMRHHKLNILPTATQAPFAFCKNPCRAISRKSLAKLHRAREIKLRATS